MIMLADIALQNALTIGAIVVGAIVAFWLIRKIVRIVVSLAIVALLAAAALVWCVRAGYIAREDAERLNPLNSEAVRQAVRDAGAWAGAQAKDAAKKAVDAAIDEAVRAPRTTDDVQRNTTRGEQP